MADPALAQRERRPAQQPAQTPKIEPMRVMLVGEAGDYCKPNCREWISAEGDLTADTPREFERVFRQLGNRKVPILIHSRGGSVEAAQRIGRMIRQRGLDIAVARTWFNDCGTGSLNCPSSPTMQARKQQDKAPALPMVVTGLPEFAGEHSRRRAGCASACSYLIAGGVRRAAAEHAVVGVHQITRTRTHLMRRYIVHYRMINGHRQEVSRQLVSTRPTGTEVFQPSANDPAYRKVKAYLASLGVSGELVDLGMKSGPKEMHYLTRDELTRTGVINVGLSVRELFAMQEGAPKQTSGTLASRGTPASLGEAVHPVIGTGELILDAIGERTTTLVFDVVAAPDPQFVNLRFRSAQNGPIATDSLQQLTLRFARPGHDRRVLIAARQYGLQTSGVLVTPVTPANLCTIRAYGYIFARLEYSGRGGETVHHASTRPLLSWQNPLPHDFCRIALTQVIGRN